MIDRSIAVFSGVHPKVVEQLAPTLRSTGIEPVTVSIGESPTGEYFERLAKQALHVARKEAGRSDVRLAAALISGLADDELETATFFPALRRVLIPPEWRNNPSAAKKIATVVQDHFRGTGNKEFTRQLAARRDVRLLLPPKNTPSKALAAQFAQIYTGSLGQLSARVNKEVVVQSKGRGLKISNLQFAPTVNGEQHPVRRCTDTCSCDLKAAFRFGALVPARYEFDVTAENGLATKSFHLCSGEAHRVSAEATHLNMRINDDFREG